MAEKTTEASPFNWRLLLFAALAAFAVSISIAVCQAGTALFLYLFLVGPILAAFTIALLVHTIIGKGRRKRLTLLSTLATVWVVLASASLFAYRVDIRSSARWLLWSHTYKYKLLAQQPSANGEFRHGAGRTPLFILFSTREIRFRQLLQLINQVSLTAYPAQFLK